MRSFSTFTVEKKSFTKLEKEQLSKVIGGSGDAYDATTANAVLKTKHDTAKNSVGNIR